MPQINEQNATENQGTPNLIAGGLIPKALKLQTNRTVNTVRNYEIMVENALTPSGDFVEQVVDVVQWITGAGALGSLVLVQPVVVVVIAAACLPGVALCFVSDTKLKIVLSYRALLVVLGLLFCSYVHGNYNPGIYNGNLIKMERKQ